MYENLICQGGEPGIEATYPHNCEDKLSTLKSKILRVRGCHCREGQEMGQ